MEVFEQQSLLDHWDLFITVKPKEVDAFEALEEELEPAEETKKGSVPGQPPENLKPT